MTDSKKSTQREISMLFLIPSAVIVLGYLALWSRSVTLRVLSQIVYYTGYPTLAEPMAERAVRMTADPSVSMLDKLWSVWTLCEIYRAQHKYAEAMPGYRLIVKYNQMRGSNPAFMYYQSLSRLSETLHALHKDADAAQYDQYLREIDAKPAAGKLLPAPEKK